MSVETCSSGEEAYSIASLVRQNSLLPGVPSVHILATDISNRVLSIARNGIYREERFAGLSHDWKQRNLLRSIDGRPLFKVKPELRRLIEFRRFNLMESFAGLGPFSIIFCRNVMIYFDKPLQDQTLKLFYDSLEPLGFLALGAKETLKFSEINKKFKQLDNKEKIWRKIL